MPEPRNASPLSRHIPLPGPSEAGKVHRATSPVLNDPPVTVIQHLPHHAFALDESQSRPCTGAQQQAGPDPQQHCEHAAGPHGRPGLAGPGGPHRRHQQGGCRGRRPSQAWQVCLLVGLNPCMLGVQAGRPRSSGLAPSCRAWICGVLSTRCWARAPRNPQTLHVPGTCADTWALLSGMICRDALRVTSNVMPDRDAIVTPDDWVQGLRPRL